MQSEKKETSWRVEFVKFVLSRRPTDRTSTTLRQVRWNSQVERQTFSLRQKFPQRLSDSMIFSRLKTVARSTKRKIEFSFFVFVDRARFSLELIFLVETLFCHWFQGRRAETSTRVYRNQRSVRTSRSRSIWVDSFIFDEKRRRFLKRVDRQKASFSPFPSVDAFQVEKFKRGTFSRPDFKQSNWEKEKSSRKISDNWKPIFFSAEKRKRTTRWS